LLTGHPKGLYRLFFIEMWERLAFYTMVGILLLYTIDTESGGLGLSRVVGNEIYGLYLAFVYFTPYLGGLIADRFLGYRKSVLIGGLFFALGFFLMSVYGRVTFISGLVCLCVGNGFFKPNISVMVGNLYERGDPKRDAGFNIFYMGINIGAFIANFLAAFARNTLGGWPAVFLAAAAGMLIGITILLASWKVLERADRRPERGPDDTTFGEIFAKILVPALVFGVIGYFLAKRWLPDGSAMRPAVCGFLAGMVPILIFFVRLGTGAKEQERPGLLALLPVYLAGATFFMVLHLNGSAMTAWALDKTDRQLGALPAIFQRDALPSYYHNAAPDTPRPNRQSLLAVDSLETAQMYGQQRMSTQALADLALPDGVRVQDIPLTGDKNPQESGWEARACNVYEQVKTERSRDSHGVEIVSVSVAQGAKPVRRVAFVRDAGDGKPLALFVTDRATYDGMYAGNPPELPPGEFLQVANSELFQSLNALFVVAFTPLIVWLFELLRRRGIDFSTARKIFVGLVLTTVSLLMMVLAGVVGDNGAIKVSWLWLVLFYAVITVGELCLSPMALSLVTKLSPKRFVGLTMGGWFLATAFGNNFSGFFGGLDSRMTPISFFLLLSGIAGAVALVIGVLLPKLDRAIKQYGA
jgi:dipeptide/tripeptide permease